ncbi:MAG: TadE/TadG family type IV pilus assembly protein [Xanthobacteraceae bacterium]|jgi:Flp pilus assembly protein TadG
MTWLTHLFLRFTRCRDATSAVEFTILVPVFLVLVFGIIVFGSYLAIVHGVQQLAAEAARRSIAGLNDTERASLAAGYVSANAASYPLIAANRLTVVSATSGSNVFVVTVDYDASQSFIYALPTFVPMPPSRIERSAAIPFGGF